MKFILSTLLTLLVISSQQPPKGIVYYKQTTQIKVELPPELAAQFKDKIPSEKSSNFNLYFSPKATLFRSAEATSTEQSLPTEETNELTIMVGQRGEEAIFKDFTTQQLVEQKDLFGRSFLIKEPLPEQTPWKLTGQQKQIGDYLCQQAILQRDSTLLTAWFTPEIPISSGPQNLGGLPGLILEVAFPNGKSVITAERIEFTDFDSTILTPPTKGKNISREKFQQLREEKLEEMGFEKTGDGKGRIKIEMRKF